MDGNRWYFSLWKKKCVTLIASDAAVFSCTMQDIKLQ